MLETGPKLLFFGVRHLGTYDIKSCVHLSVDLVPYIIIFFSHIIEISSRETQVSPPSVSWLPFVAKFILYLIGNTSSSAYNIIINSARLVPSNILMKTLIFVLRREYLPSYRRKHVAMCFSSTYILTPNLCHQRSALIRHVPLTLPSAHGGTESREGSRQEDTSQQFTQDDSWPQQLLGEQPLNVLSK